MKFIVDGILFCFAAVALAAPLSAVRADEIKGMVAIGMQSSIEELAPQFQKTTGHALVAKFALGGELHRRFLDGEETDVLVVARGNIDSLIKDSKLIPGSDITLARSGVGIAIRNGDPKPDISTPEALRRALLSARAISYSDPAFGGASGVHFAKVLEQLGITEEMKAKTKFPPRGGFAGNLLVSGEVDLAIQQIPELLSVKGAALVGPLPSELQTYNVYAAGIPMTTKKPDAARAFLNFLQSPEAVNVIKAKGLEAN